MMYLPTGQALHSCSCAENCPLLVVFTRECPKHHSYQAVFLNTFTLTLIWHGINIEVISWCSTSVDGD
jgi:hypothetical protein